MPSRLAVHVAGRVLGSAAAVIGLVVTTAGPASGLPAFARKYGTSCLTCHTIYPVLNPFGEGFRRNGFRFPGIDSDYWKQDPVPLGQDAQKKSFPHAAWPGSLPASVPIAVGFNGQAVVHPDRKAGGAIADNGARVTLGSLVEEGHVWAGGSFDDKITFFGEMTVGDEGASLELAQVRFNDLIGPKHAVNLVAGLTIPTISSFGPHATYLGDAAVTPLSVTALYGATSDSWNVAQAYRGLELNGTIRGRLDWSVGTNSGANVDVRDTEDFYAHAGYKIGGLRLDAEGVAGPADAMKPWAESALTLYGFYYRSVSRFTASTDTAITDRTPTVGGGLRAQWGSWSLDSGVYRERHDHARADGEKVEGLAQYNELAFVGYPWLVPAVRVEYLRLKPGGEAAVTDLRVFAGVAAIVRPNLKLNVIAQIERAQGAPTVEGGWSAASGLALPPDLQSKVNAELEAITIGLAYAF